MKRKLLIAAAAVSVALSTPGAYALILPQNTQIQFNLTGVDAASSYAAGLGTFAFGPAAVDLLPGAPAPGAKPRLAGDTLAPVFGNNFEDTWGIFYVNDIRDVNTAQIYWSPGTTEMVGMYYNNQDIYVKDLTGLGLFRIDVGGGFFVIYEQAAGTFAGAGGFGLGTAGRLSHATYAGVGAGGGAVPVLTGQFTDSGYFFAGPGNALNGGSQTTLSEIFNFGPPTAGNTSAAITLGVANDTGGPLAVGANNSDITPGAYAGAGANADLITQNPLGVAPAGIADWSVSFNGAFVAQTIPEPSTAALLGVGILGIVMRRRRQASKV